MIRPVLAVRDNAANAFNGPFVAHSVGTAIRSFAGEVKRVDANNTLNTHPADFELWYLADFDDEAGVFTAAEKRAVARAADYVE